MYLPSRIFKDISLYDQWHDGVMVAKTNVGAMDPILACQVLYQIPQLQFSCAGGRGGGGETRREEGGVVGGRGGEGAGAEGEKGKIKEQSLMRKYW